MIKKTLDVEKNIIIFLFLYYVNSRLVVTENIRFQKIGLNIVRKGCLIYCSSFTTEMGARLDFKQNSDPNASLEAKAKMHIPLS